MKKRMLSLLLCLCMTAALLTPTAWAASWLPEGHEEQQENDEASVTIGNTTTYYENLSDAWLVAVNGEAAAATITLLKDAAITTTPGLGLNNPDKEITLIGTGHTVTGTQLLSIMAGTLNLQGGKFSGSAGAGALYIGAQTDGGSSSAVVNISDGTTLEAASNLTAGAVMIGGGQLNITGGEIKGQLVGIYVNGGTVNISGGEISSSLNGGIALDCANGTTTVSGNAKIKGTATNKGTGIFLRSYDHTSPTVTIEGGMIEARTYGIEALAGTLIVNEGTIRSTGGQGLPDAGIRVGSLFLYSEDDPENPKLQSVGNATINGGMISGVDTGVYHDGYVATRLKLNGGTFSATGDNPSIKIDLYATYASWRLKEILGTDKAYFRDSGRVPDSELTGQPLAGSQTLTGTITVKESTSEEPAPSGHQHAWSGDWATDANHHWHNCTAADCPITDNGLKEGAGAHVYDNDADATCNTCGYTRTVSSGDTPVAPPVIDTPVYYPPAPTGGASDASSSGSKPSEDKAEQAPVTTTTTDERTGAVTETTFSPDGSSVAITTQTDGTTATVTTAASGRTETAVSLSSGAVAAAQQSGEAVALPIAEVPVVRSAAAAPVLIVHTDSDQPVKVEVPAVNPTPGTVAVLVKADGTEEVIKTSVPTADGVAVSLPDGATVKIVDNSKDFADISPAHWAGDAVDFVTARELFSGTSETAFTPDAPMTRAMLVTVLARLDGADTTGGATWYEKGVEWAVTKGISDGSNPNDSITREQLAVMLWRYAGSPAAAGSLGSFADADAVNGYAQEAMRWAVEAGVISGLGNGQLAPKGQATRAQVAQMLKNFMESK